MPKVDLTAAYKTQGMSSKDRKKNASVATSAILSGGLILMDQQPDVPVQEIELSKIKLREINKFHEIDNIELDESIRQYGLINPIAVCHHEGEDVYTISAGERRYKSVVRLHERYPNNPRFQKIECKVYILTSDSTLLEQGFPYITEEQEEGIYRDSNLQARQLTDQDIAGQIRRIVARFDDESYVEELRKTAREAGFKTYSNPDKTKLIANVLMTQNIWSREKIRQYMKIYESKQEDMLDAIERGELQVKTAYNQLINKNNLKRIRNTKKLPTLIKITDAMAEEAKKRKYTADDIANIQKCIDTLQAIIDNRK